MLELTPPDPRQFAEEVDIGPKLPSGFTEAIASSKWKERKEALDGLYALLSKALRIKDVPELGPVIKALASRMADANINCVITAATCIDAMARGLQNSFAKYGEAVVPPMLERLKERKQTVTDAIGSALDAVFATVRLSNL
jgi:cytoskeleton-associated protein 5